MMRLWDVQSSTLDLSTSYSQAKQAHLFLSVTWSQLESLRKWLDET